MLQSIKRFIRFALIGTGTVFFLVLIVFYLPNTKVADTNQSIFVPTDTSFETLKEILEPHLKSTITFSLAAKAMAFAANENVIVLFRWGSKISFSVSNDVSVGTKIDWLVSATFVLGK